MAFESYTGTIYAPEWASVTSLTGVSFSGDFYNLQVRNQCQFKVGDAIFDANYRDVEYTPSEGELYIKTGDNECGLTILEA